MVKKVKNLIITGIIVAVVAIAGVFAYHYYQESQKSGVEKAVDKTADATKDAADWTEKNTRKAAKWTEKTADKAADKTKELFKK